MKVYPFKFLFEINSTLEARTLLISHTVKNLDDHPMFFSLGGHPAFNVPPGQDEEYEDYYLQFDRKMDLFTHLSNDDELVANGKRKIAENDDLKKLHKHLFDNDALIFKSIPSKKVTWKSRKSSPC